MSEIELKPCPFCGGEAGHEHLENGRRSVGCQREGCIAFISTTTFATLREAITAWNTRSQSERVSRLEEALKPFVAVFEAKFERYERVNSNWHHEMPGEWPIELMMMVADCRRARSALNQGADDGR